MYVLILFGFFVLGLWDLGGDQDFTIFEQIVCIDESAAKWMKINLKGSPNSP